MALVFMIPGEGRMDAGLGRQIGSRRCDGLDAGLFIARDDRNRFALVRLGMGLFQHFDFTIDAQNLGHLPFELGVTIFEIVAHLVRFDFLVAEDLAYGALDQMGQAPMPCRRPPFTCMIGQQSRRPQLVWIAVVLGLVARQRYQPGLGLRRDRWFLTGPRPIVERRKRPMGQGPLDAALDCLMVHPHGTADRKERRILAVGEQHPRPHHPAPSFCSGSGNRRQLRNVLATQCQFDRLSPSTHRSNPRFDQPKRGIRQQTHRSMMAGFMESVV
jgi:hypothetical protein